VRQNRRLVKHPRRNSRATICDVTKYARNTVYQVPGELGLVLLSPSKFGAVFEEVEAPSTFAQPIVVATEPTEAPVRGVETKPSKKKAKPKKRKAKTESDLPGPKPV
jgi:hypothetical protein